MVVINGINFSLCINFVRVVWLISVCDCFGVMFVEYVFFSVKIDILLLVKIFMLVMVVINVFMMVI